MLTGAESEWGNLIKRPLLQFPGNGNGNLPYSISTLCSEQLMKMMLKPQLGNPPKGSPLEEMKTVQSTSNQNPQLIQAENLLIEKQNLSQLVPYQPDPINSNLPKINANGNLHPANKFESQTQARSNHEKLKLESEHSTDQLSQLTSTSECNEEKLAANVISPTILSQLSFTNQNQIPFQLQNNPWPIQSQSESSAVQAHQMQVSQADISTLSGFLPFSDTDEWTSHLSSCQPLGGIYRSPGSIPVSGLQDSSAVFPEATNPSLTTEGQDTWDHQLNNCRFLSQADQLASFTQQDPCSLNSGGL